MHKFSVLAYLILFFAPFTIRAQENNPDSIRVIPVGKYDSVSAIHRKVFGENYRKEYAKSTLVPVLKLSEISGGLKAFQLGGGNQSRSLRLKDSSGREWLLRSVQKYPGTLLPVPLRETFLLEIIEDNMSAQHPFGALVIPPLASAAGIPHSHPIIGWVAPDRGLGIFSAGFEGTLCLLEEREPIGKSDNTARMMKQLSKNNVLRVDWQTYLKSKALDILVGDWDRHEDQWRWAIDPRGDSTLYIPVPRDRDQVFYRSDGMIQRLAQSNWFLPMMQGYERKIQDINWFLWEGRNINTQVFAGVELNPWNATIKDFCARMTDSVLRESLSKLPNQNNREREQQLLSQMKVRRDALPALMESYFRFFNRIVDVSLSDQDESIVLTDKADGQLQLQVNRSSQTKQGETILLSRRFDPAITREIRIFMRGGNDRVLMNAKDSKIRIRIVGGADKKNIKSYSKATQVVFYGKPDDQIGGIFKKWPRKKISTDTANFSYLASDRYSRKSTLPNLGFNSDDGLMVGGTHMFTRPGFRKQPYASVHSISALYAWNTSAFFVHYSGEWIKAAANQDFLMQMTVNAPNNTRSFFGIGNETVLDKNANSIRFYRAQFTLLTFKTALRQNWKKHSLSYGPIVQYYQYAQKENTDRFISRYLEAERNEMPQVEQSKLQIGAAVQLLIDTRDNKILPRSGVSLKSYLELLAGLHRDASYLGTLSTQFAFYMKINAQGSVVFSNRVGTGASVGNPEFYQLPALGGTENLTGYRNYRFIGDFSAYNNSEIRVKIGDFLSYILPGELGLTGIYDVGRVWKKGEESNALHHGVGAGLYFSPASYCIFNLVAGYSKEGWYPTFSLKSRF